jgi:hypothetical protein
MTTKTSWNRLRKLVKKRDKATCFHCGKVAEDGHCDHLIPLSRGGTDSLLNLVWSCKSCNTRRGNKFPKWLSDLQKPTSETENEISISAPQWGNILPSLFTLIVSIIIPRYPKYNSESWKSFEDYFSWIIFCREFPILKWSHDTIWTVDKDQKIILDAADGFIEKKRRYNKIKKYGQQMEDYEIDCPECGCSTKITWETEETNTKKTAKWLCPGGHYGDTDFTKMDVFLESLESSYCLKACLGSNI